VDNLIGIGMDTSKSVFQLHGVNAAERPVLRRRLRRRQVLEFFAKLPRLRVGLKPAVRRITGRVNSAPCVAEPILAAVMCDRDNRPDI
jgi:hypothetical protein